MGATSVLDKYTATYLLSTNLQTKLMSAILYVSGQSTVGAVDSTTSQTDVTTTTVGGVETTSSQTDVMTPTISSESGKTTDSSTQHGVSDMSISGIYTTIASYVASIMGEG